MPENKCTAYPDAKEMKDAERTEVVPVSSQDKEHGKELWKMKCSILFDHVITGNLNEVISGTKLGKYPFWPHQPIENLKSSSGGGFGQTSCLIKNKWECALLPSNDKSDHSTASLADMHCEGTWFAS